MEPVGSVEFDAVPERWVTYSPDYADMGVALGLGSRLAGVGTLDRYPTTYYEGLPGVGFEEAPEPFADGDDPIDPADLAAFDADVHLIDPNWLVQTSAFELDATDVDDIDEDVAPFLGNTIYTRAHEWHSYRYYTLYEAFETVAAVFRRQDRFEALATVHDEWLAALQTDLPSAEHRPDGLLVRAVDDGEFRPLRIADQGTHTKQWRDLGVADALGDLSEDELLTTDRGTIGLGTIDEIDPDVLLVRGDGVGSPDDFERDLLPEIEANEDADDVRAIRDGRVFHGGPRYQGPLVNLFTTEYAAQSIYPDVFSRSDLFDRERIADLVRDGPE